VRGSTYTVGLLDTSTVILLSRLTDPAVLPKEPVISAITLAELMRAAARVGLLDQD
jgi:predicted nucleic acid-binding protein